MGVGTELRTAVRAALVLNCWTISPLQWFSLCVVEDEWKSKGGLLPIIFHLWWPHVWRRLRRSLWAISAMLHNGAMSLASSIFFSLPPLQEFHPFPDSGYIWRNPLSQLETNSQPNVHVLSSYNHSEAAGSPGLLYLYLHRATSAKSILKDVMSHFRLRVQNMLSTQACSGLWWFHWRISEFIKLCKGYIFSRNSTTNSECSLY